MAKISNKWNPDNGILVSRFSELTTLEDNLLWKAGLESVCGEIIETPFFKLLLDVRGYEFDSALTHKFHREIIPRFLARHRFTLSFLSDIEITEINKDLKLENKTCIAVAMIHHDRRKMDGLNEAYGKPNEGYFSSYTYGAEWIERIGCLRRRGANQT